MSPTVLYDPSAPLTHLFRFELTNRNSIKFQVFDKDFTDSTFVGDRGQSAGVMMAEEIVDIRPWIANGRFEGDIKLHRGGGDTFQAGDPLSSPYQHTLESHPIKQSLKHPINTPLLTILSPWNMQTGLKLQLNVKLTYPGRKRPQKYLVGSAGFLVLNPRKEILLANSAATAAAAAAATAAAATAATATATDVASVATTRGT